MRYDVSGNLVLSQLPDPVVVVEPTEEPVSLEEVKQHLRIDDDLTADDDLLDSLIQSARQHIEKTTGLALVDQTLEVRLDAYPSNRVIALRGPLLGGVSLSYTDASGTIVALDEDQYVVEAALKNRAPRIVLGYGVTWPYSVPVSDAIRVRWRAGFADLTGSPTESVSQVPAPLRAAIKLHVEAHYDRDERTFDMLMKAVESLCNPYRVDFGIA